MKPQQITNLQNARMVYETLEEVLDIMAQNDASFSLPFEIHLVHTGLKLTGQITREQPEAQDGSDA